MGLINIRELPGNKISTKQKKENLGMSEYVKRKKLDMPLNQILYGPSGTGKTYDTKNYAVAIIEGKDIDAVRKEDYGEVLQRYDNYVKRGQVKFVTFHQSYSYEEFVEGIKPVLQKNELFDCRSTLEYVLQDGIFKRMAKIAGEKNNFDEAYDKLLSNINKNGGDIKLKTKKDRPFKISINGNSNLNLFTGNDEKPNGSITKEKLRLCSEGKELEEWQYYYSPVIEYLKSECGLKDFFGTSNENEVPYVLIIDEINRGNISKIFGELITLLEDDKRDVMSVILPYSQEEFTVPKNLYIIGTMNTVDRSITAMDIVLRRRFTFKEMMPNVELVEYSPAKEVLEKLNKRISILLGRDHQIGHSYFMNVKNMEDFRDIWFDKIIPLLNEYFYGDWKKLQKIIPGFIDIVDIPKDLLDLCGDENVCRFVTKKECENILIFENKIRQMY